MSRAAARVPPHDKQAEVSLLGAAMLSPTALEVLASDTVPEDFYVPANEHIAAALRTMWLRGNVKVDPVLLADELKRNGLLERCGGLPELVSIMGNTPATSNASRYAEIIVELATLREMAMVGSQIQEMAYSAPADVAAATDEARSLLGSLELPVAQGQPSADVYGLLEATEEYDWLVPGLLERGDRIILTAEEGFGKSTLIRQVGVQLASGMHPFQFHPVPPVRVLIVDVENSLLQVQRQLRPLVQLGKPQAGMLRMEVHPEGIDLTQRHDSRWLMERVASNQPDLLCIGPVYKLHADDPNDELPARRVAKVLDMVRTRYKCALLIEAHVPHERKDLRPFGASLWRRWPEFGYGLAEDKKAGDRSAWFNAWRGGRDAREWPRKLERGNPWPWVDSSYRPPPDPSF